MKIRVLYDDGHDYGEFEYYSKFDRKNAKGIKDEIRHEIIKNYGYSRSEYIEIKSWGRCDD